MAFSLPLDTYSPDQLSGLVLELQDLATSVRDATNRGEGAVQMSPDLATLLTQNNVADNDAGAIEQLAREAADTLEKAPTIHILLAAMPGRAQKRQFITWFRTEVSPTALLTFAARSDLGGGAIIQAGSHLYDLSFRRGIIDSKARLTEIASV
jgi:F0F1-type ATP synthase delta subunit